MAGFSASRRLVTFGGLCALLSPRVIAAAQGPAPPARRLGIFEDLPEGAYRWTGRHTGRHIMFMAWELPGQVLSWIAVTHNHRSIEINKFNADGTIEASSERGYSTGTITETGSLIGEEINRGSRATYEVSRGAEGALRLVGELQGVPIDWTLEPVPMEEAMRIAARLYPAEYGPSRVASPRPQGGAPAARAARLALVVGIGNYRALPDLANPVNDARAIATRLGALGYRVDAVYDPDLATLWEAVGRFRTALENSPARSPALFYYAGHGVEMGGRNLLLPADMQLQAANLDSDTVPVDAIVEQMTVGGERTRIVILDACRNSPLQRPGVGSGLAQITAPEGTFIAFSTAPGMVAADGSGRNSPFAQALLRELAAPQQAIEVLFRSVRRAVVRTTNGMQVPWDSSSLLEPFSFGP